MATNRVSRQIVLPHFIRFSDNIQKRPPNTFQAKKNTREREENSKKTPDGVPFLSRHCCTVSNAMHIQSKDISTKKPHLINFSMKMNDNFYKTII